jgi:uncharacterized membrane protein
MAYRVPTLVGSFGTQKKFPTKVGTLYASSKIMSSAESQQPIAWTYLAVALLALVGLADSLYLTVQDLSGQTIRCTMSGCSEVLSSPYSHIGSVPLAALGAVAYFAVFSLAILVAFGYRSARPLLAGLSAVMFLMTLWLLYLQAFVIHHFCQYCLLSAAVTTTVTAIVWGSRIMRRRK